MRLLPVLSLPLLLLAGCSLQTTASPSPETGIALQGIVHGGQQPVIGAHVYLLAASTSGYGSASASLLTSGTAGSDSIGGYVLSGAGGQFSITGDYTCTLGQQVYLYALGGNPGAGTNSLSGMMAAVGSCPAAGNFGATVPFIYMNELSTVALAYSAAGFATDPLHISASSTSLAATGLANAFAAPANLVSTSLGSVLGTTPAGNGIVPASEIDTLANVLAACVNTNGTVSGPSSPTACYTLVNNAKNGSTLPSDTAYAAINIAHNPTANLTALFNLQTATAPFVPKLSGAPNDFTLNVTYSGGGLATSSDQTNGVALTMNNIAIDANGDVWKPNYGANSLSEFSPLGVALSGSSGFLGGGLSEPANVAIDLSGNVWTGNVAGNSVSKFSSAGSAMSGSPYSAGGISAPADLAIDGSGNIWIANGGTETLTKLNSNGTGASGSPFSTNPLVQAVGIAILPSGNVWVSDALSNDTAVYTSSGAQAGGSPFAGGSQDSPYGVAFDSNGDGWIADVTAVTRLTTAGAAGSSPFNAASSAVLTAVAIDGLGNAWVTDTANNVILELSNSGSYLSGTNGFQSGQTAVPEAIAIDGSGNLWYSTLNDATIHELIGAAAPVVTPLAYGVQNSKLGTRP